ncbi:MAG: hypothetical protein WKF36_09870 [Candidatus Nitrosocosmicus sp.]
MSKPKKLTPSKFVFILTISMMIATIYECPVYAQITNSSVTAIQTGPLEMTNANSSIGLSSLSMLAQNGTNTSEGTFNGNNSDNNDNFNATQLSGDEKVSISANFLPKPAGLPNDYVIEGRPAISINGITWDFEYPIDNNDGISLSDILMSMTATIKVNSNSNSNETGGDDVYQVRIFANPENVTESSDGTKRYWTGPNSIEHIQLHDTFYCNIVSEAVVYPNGSGFLKAHN